MAKKKKELKEVSKKEIEIPIKWHISESIVTRFASNMVIQNIENDFKISFFEVNPDIRTGDNDPIPTEVRADCVASIIVTAERMPKFINALIIQYSKKAKGSMTDKTIKTD